MGENNTPNPGQQYHGDEALEAINLIGKKALLSEPSRETLNQIALLCVKATQSVRKMMAEQKKEGATKTCTSAS